LDQVTRSGAATRAALAVALVASWTAALAPPATATDPSLARVIGTQMRLAGGSSGAWVADATTGEVVFASLAEVRRTPASVQKLLTTTTALERFGDQEHIKTIVRSDGRLEDGILKGDLYLQGFGDPSFGSRALAVLASRVHEAGIEQVEGRIFGDESYFDSRRGLPSDGFRLSSDVGPLSALSFNEGTLRRFGAGFQLNPPTFVAQRLHAWLDARGVDVMRGAREKRTPPSAELVASVRSPSIASLVRKMNQPSDNYYAETLLKGLGARFGGSGSTAAGADVVKRFQASIGVTSSVLDGSGLSRGDAISPHSVGRLLLAAEQRPWFASFYRSLPLAGRSGTLRKRMRGTAASGNCRAKTGTLIGVSGLAGYCRARSDRRFVFALLMNGANVARARAAQDRIAAALAGS
jgi:D-alanyl-D-alanine carboxypeptidase/D-alanyl-D-alanine-endopeptidase (penicillin-binding protein 4)